MSHQGDLATMPPSEGDSFPALAGAGCPDGEVVLRHLLVGSALAVATWVKSQVSSWERDLGLQQVPSYRAGLTPWLWCCACPRVMCWRTLLLCAPGWLFAVT